MTFRYLNSYILALLIFLLLGCESKFEESEWLSPNYSNVTQKSLLKNNYEHLPDGMPLYGKEFPDKGIVKYQFKDFNTDILISQTWSINKDFPITDSLKQYFLDFNCFLIYYCSSDSSRFKVFNQRFNTYYFGSFHNENKIFISYHHPIYQKN